MSLRFIDDRKLAIIVASGPSAKDMLQCEIDKRKYAIFAVNGVADWLPYFDYWFTLDPTAENRYRMKHQKKFAKYYAACPDRFPECSHIYYLNRRSFDFSKKSLIPKIGLSNDPDFINSGNSAFGALGLAYHMGFSRVALIGVDATNHPRCEGGVSGDLSHLPALFESAMGQIDIINCGGMLSKLPKLKLSSFAGR